MPETATRPKRPATGGRARVHFDVDALAALALTLYRTSGRWPSATNGDPIAGTGRTWKDFDKWLARRGTTLPGLLDQRFPVERSPLTDERVAASALAHFQATRAWPTERSADRVDGSGETWEGIGTRFRRRGVTLAAFLDATFPAERARSRPTKHLAQSGRADVELVARVAAQPPAERISRADRLAELKGRVESKPRPVHRYGPANLGERDHEVDNPAVHGWWSVPDSWTPEERARALAAGVAPGTRYAGEPVGGVAGREDDRRARALACRQMVEEFRRVRKRHRKLARQGRWDAATRAKGVGRAN